MGLSWLLVSLAAWILISGLDDLLVDLVWAWGLLRGWLRSSGQGRAPPEEALLALPEKRVAIFVPLWQESQVIGKMIAHNLPALRYHQFEVFIGCYPNDEPTLDAVRALEARYPQVHLALCPHDGPTSKADCLNWIYQRMLQAEEDNGERFEVIVTHDAEDVIHPESLRWINYFLQDCDMVQIPVLPLPTPFWKLTHGIYCDEFAEYQHKDIPVRGMLGGFIPSNGVGTGYSRRALEVLAEAEANRVFEPCCLTEDYENGLRLCLYGFRQRFIPVRKVGGAWLATREYFPERQRTAVKQRTRWVTGIALQSWERHGWRGGLRQIYWLWRDRKGIFGNPLSLATNALFAYGMVSYLWSRLGGGQWVFQRLTLPSGTEVLLGCTLALQAVQTLIRCACCARIYGPVFAIGTPLRAFWANWINSRATVRALFRYALARWRGEPLVWLKTEHAYPSRASLIERRRPLKEILVEMDCLSLEEVEEAEAGLPEGVSLGQHLLRLGVLTDRELCEALAWQQGVPSTWIEPQEVNRAVARALPARLIGRWRCIPFQVRPGKLFLATVEPPGEEAHRELRRFTGLDPNFHLVPRANYEKLVKELL